MKNQFVKYIIFLYLFLLWSRDSYGQGIIDFDRDPPYKKVFIETDNFGISYLDDLALAYPKFKVDSIQFSALNDLAYYWHTRNLSKALEYTRTGLEITRRKKNREWEGRFQITEAAILLRMEKLDTAYTILQDAKTKVPQKDLAFLNTQLGYVFERKGELVRAADYALESKRLGEELNDVKALAVAYSDLSNLFWKHARYEKGLEYGLISLSLFEERGMNDLDYDFTLYVVGNNLLQLENHEKALKYFNHSIVIGERYGFYNNLSDVYISLVDLHAYFKQYDKAVEAGENAIKYATLLDNSFMLMRSWLSIGKLQILQGKYISAIESLKKCLEVATPEFGDNYYLSQAFESLGKAYAGNHNYKDAYNAFAVYDSLKNQIFTKEADHRISLLQTEFDLANKESTIKGMEDRIERQRSNQTMILVSALLLLLLLLVLFITFHNNKRKNSLLKKQNEEKEFLLKEVHHRVKNNLGIVSSLLDLQAAKMKDPKVVGAIQESRNRVYSMSIIHQKLYQGSNLSVIGMKDYLVNLSKHILDSYGAEKTIRFDYLLDDLDLDVDTAIPIGLIVNELLTNSFKHAFPDKRKGKIKITLKKLENERVLLQVSDNGIGLSKIDEEDESTGFGTQLIDLLIQQLDGSILISNDLGTKVRMEFGMN